MARKIRTRGVLPLSLVLGLTTVSMAAAVPLPLVFESNQGQTDPSVRFIARSQGSSLFLLDDGGAVLSLPGADKTHYAVRMSIEGGQTLPGARGIGEHGKANYYRGNDPKRWISGIPTWDRAHYAAVYPGIDLVYYANDKRLEFDFVVAPGADPAKILLGFEGLKAGEGEKELEVDGDGRLLLATPAGEVALDAPQVYQDVDGERRTVEGRYQLADAGKVRFALGAYDASRPLVIDPVIIYSSYLGGSQFDSIEALAADADGNSLTVGYTFSPDFPLVNPVLPTLPGGFDLHVTKVSADGSHIVYSTFLGSSPSPGETGTEWPGGIAVDAAGNAYVSGLTQGANFPVLNAVQPVYGGAADIFVTKLGPAGALLYSTYLGGSSTDIPGFFWPSNIAVTPDGKAYVSGRTYSTDYPQVNGAQTSLSVDTGICSTPETGTCSDMVLTVLSAAGDQILYSTYWGGPEEEDASAVAVDPTGAAYLLGFGVATTPLVNPFKPAYEPGDMIVVKIRPDGTPPVYATFVEGHINGAALDLDVDGEGAAYVTFQTFATDLPVPYAIQPVNAGADWYLTRINPRGTGIDFATYFGGPGFDVPWDLDVDAMGNMVVSGYGVDNFPLPVLHPLFPATDHDGHVIRIHPTGPTLLYSTPLGGGRAFGAGFGSRGDVFLGGGIVSLSFPLLSPFQPASGGGDGEAFVRRMSDGFATLATPSRIPSQPGATVTVPVRFTPGGFDIAFAALSVDYDEDCLTFDPTDANADGIPDSIVFNLPPGYGKSVQFNAADVDGEIDISIFDPSPPFTLLPLGEPASITFGVQPTCGASAVSTLARVGFSSAPQVSFGTVLGQSAPGISLDGSVQVWGGLRGDCNGDLAVNAGDLGASVLEVFDTDGAFWLDAPLSSFNGSPAGCDANADLGIDAGDLSCTVLLIFQGPGACDAMPRRAAQPPVLELQATRAPVGPGGEVRIPINLIQEGRTAVNSVAFSLALPASATLDPTDRNGDGVPDAISFSLPPGFVGSLRWTPENQAGQLAVLIYDPAGRQVPLPPSSTLAVITLTQRSLPMEAVRFGTAPTASFGEVGGNSIQGLTRVEGE